MTLTRIRTVAFVFLVASALGRPASAQTGDLDPRIVNLVGSVSEERLSNILQEAGELRDAQLAVVDDVDRPAGSARRASGFSTRCAATVPKLQVSFDTYQVAKQGRITRDVEMRNVMAILPGRSPRRIYVSGHYDTVARPGGQSASNAGGGPPPDPDARTAAPADPNAPLDNLAPGVNDDGSGTALTIELARVFSQSGIDFDATLVFMCHVGEEQGLVGARLHAQKAVAEKIPIEAVLNNDIVGNDKGGNGIVDGATIRVYSEGPEDSPSRSLARFVQRWGGRYVPSHKVRPMARPDRFGRGGDHSAYNQLGFHRRRLPRIARELRPAARRTRHVRGDLAAVSGAERPRQRGRGRDAGARAAAAGCHQRARPAADHAGAVRLRRDDEMDRGAGRRRLPGFLARGVGRRLAARHAGGQRDHVRDARTCRSTITSLAWRPSTPPATKAS